MARDTDNFEDWVQQANAMQAQLTQASTSLAEATATGTAGAGAVTVTLDATGELCEIRIDPRAADDVAALQRHIVTAHAEATAAIHQMAEDFLSPLNTLVSRIGNLDL
jgi:DNA-binding protein YbaB